MKTLSIKFTFFACHVCLQEEVLLVILQGVVDTQVVVGSTPLAVQGEGSFLEVDNTLQVLGIVQVLGTVQVEGTVHQEVVVQTLLHWDLTTK